MMQPRICPSMKSSVRSSCQKSFVSSRGCRATQRIVCAAGGDKGPQSRREFVLNSFNVGVLGTMFLFGAVERPSGLGLQDYGGGNKQLSLCPKTANCISTAEELNDPTHFVPPWTYNPEDGRGMKKPATQQQAMQELKDVIAKLRPDNFTPTIVSESNDFLYVEYQSPTFGFIDDVEFWFKPGPGSRVEYRSASRIGESDGDVNRKRIKALREALQVKKWRSIGF